MFQKTGNRRKALPFPVSRQNGILEAIYSVSFKYISPILNIPFYSLTSFGTQSSTIMWLLKLIKKLFQIYLPKTIKLETFYSLNSFIKSILFLPPQTFERRPRGLWFSFISKRSLLFCTDHLNVK